MSGFPPVLSCYGGKDQIRKRMITALALALKNYDASHYAELAAAAYPPLDEDVLCRVANEDVTVLDEQSGVFARLASLLGVPVEAAFVLVSEPQGEEREPWNELMRQAPIVFVAGAEDLHKDPDDDACVAESTEGRAVEDIRAYMLIRALDELGELVY